MRYRILHTTTYTYGALASSSRSLMHLQPRDTPRQRVLRHSFDITPAPSALSSRIDYFGNHEHTLEVGTPHASLSIRSHAEVDVDEPPSWSYELSPPWEHARCGPPPWDEARFEAAQATLASLLVPVGPAYAAVAAPFFPPGAPILSAVVAFNAHLHRHLHYQTGSTTIATTVDEVLERRRGVCQDFAHVAASCLRSLGLPVRYVSGYLRTTPRTDGRFIGSDASHAWISVRCGELGWIDLDPTNDCLAGSHHVTVAIGREFNDVTPVKGVLVGGGSGQEVAVAVTVTPES